jgi:hypothetical protein
MLLLFCHVDILASKFYISNKTEKDYTTIRRAIVAYQLGIEDIWHDNDETSSIMPDPKRVISSAYAFTRANAAQS